MEAVLSLQTKMKKTRELELEKTILNKVEQVINSINVAKHVDQLILTLHSLASLLFPLDSRAFSGTLSPSQYYPSFLFCC